MTIMVMLYRFICDKLTLANIADLLFRLYKNDNSNHKYLAHYYYYLFIYRVDTNVKEKKCLL